MFSNIRLVASDMDGTLLNSKKRISGRCMENIKKIMRNGIQFAVITGRPLFALPEQLTEIPGFRYCVLSNGAVVYDLKERCTLSRQRLPFDAVCQVVEAASKYHVALGVMIDGELCLSRRSEGVMREKYAEDKEYLKRFEKLWKVEENVWDIFKKRESHVEKFNLDFADERSYKECLESVKEISGIEISCDMPRYVEVTKKGCNKGSGLKILTEHLGLTNREVMVIGDSDNDRSMFAGGRLCVAMKNAEEHIRDLADFITLDNDEDGVAYALEKLLLNEV